MSNDTGQITHDEVLASFAYEDGKMRRLVGGKKEYPGCDNGTCRHLQIRVRNRKYYIHQLVWLYFNDSLPEQIDHIDRDPRNNRIENLRASNKSLNAMNSKMLSTNTSGVRGVSRMKGKWHASIWRDMRPINLGSFNSISEAAAARSAAEKELYPGIFK